MTMTVTLVNLCGPAGLETADPAVIGEIEAYWASIRWGRAVRMMASPDTRVPSRIEFQAASRHLPPAKRVLSALAAQSDTTWSALRLVRVASHKLTGERR